MLDFSPCLVFFDWNIGSYLLMDSVCWQRLINLTYWSLHTHAPFNRVHRGPGWTSFGSKSQMQSKTWPALVSLAGLGRKPSKDNNLCNARLYGVNEEEFVVVYKCGLGEWYENYKTAQTCTAHIHTLERKWRNHGKIRYLCVDLEVWGRAPSFYPGEIKFPQTSSKTSIFVVVDLVFLGFGSASPVYIDACITQPSHVSNLTPKQGGWTKKGWSWRGPRDPQIVKGLQGPPTPENINRGFRPKSPKGG